MATNKKSTAPTSTRPRRMVQNFYLVWLDRSINQLNTDDCNNSITKLRQVVNTFNNVDDYIDFINGAKKEKKFMISSGALGQTIISLVHNQSQVRTIYIFCGNKVRLGKWTKEWPKVERVYTDIIPICELPKQAVQDCDHDSVGKLAFVSFFHYELRLK